MWDANKDIKPHSISWFRRSNFFTWCCSAHLWHSSVNVSQPKIKTFWVTNADTSYIWCAEAWAAVMTAVVPWRHPCILMNCSVHNTHNKTAPRCVCSAFYSMYKTEPPNVTMYTNREGVKHTHNIKWINIRWWNSRSFLLLRTVTGLDERLQSMVGNKSFSPGVINKTRNKPNRYDLSEKLTRLSNCRLREDYRPMKRPSSQSAIASYMEISLVLLQVKQ